MEAISVYYTVEGLRHESGTIGRSSTQMRIDGFIFHFDDRGELDSSELLRLEGQKYGLSLGSHSSVEGNMIHFRLEKEDAWLKHPREFWRWCQNKLR